MLNKQASAFHESLPGSAASVAVVSAVHWVLDPAGTGRYVMATDGSDGLGEAWLVDDGTGLLHVDDSPAGAHRSALFLSSSTILV